MENLTKPAITKLGRRAGIKSLSDDCFETIRNLIGIKLTEAIRITTIVNSEHQTKTIMSSDVYQALNLLNYSVCESNDLSTKK